MNTKFLLTIVVLMALLAGFVTYSATTQAAPVTEQARPGVAANVEPIIADEPAVRMHSGAIQFSDGNYPDFKPHAVTPSKPDTDTGCISDENAQLRRYGGCVE